MKKCDECKKVIVPGTAAFKLADGKKEFWVCKPCMIENYEVEVNTEVN